MNCPPKALVIALAVTVMGCTIVVLVKSPRPPREDAVPQESVSTVISNYSRTFKLNTNPPIWPTPANGRSTTN